MTTKKSIPWWAYLAIGAFISAYSSFIKTKNPNNLSMTLFFYIGLLFILTGLGKLTIKKILGTKKNTNDQKTRQNFSKQLSQQERMLNQQRTQKNHYPAQYNIIHCPKCGAKHYSYHNFCSRCGARLK